MIKALTLPPHSGYPSRKIADADFETVRTLLHERSGIVLSDLKRDLVTSRLAKRLVRVGLGSFAEYARLLCHPRDGEAEVVEMINCMTTNKTEFFRERHHFDVLRTLLETRRRGGKDRRIRIWSAGCSTGQEPYSIAMLVREVLGSLDGWNVRILATDIDTEVLSRAEQGVYSAAATQDVPLELRRRWFEPTAGGSSMEMRVRRELRELVTFRRINLVDETWPIRTRFDAVFCRNVTIYFDRPTQRRLYDEFFRVLVEGGLLFIGHSESVQGLGDLFEPIGGTVYSARSAVAKRPSLGPSRSAGEVAPGPSRALHRPDAPGPEHTMTPVLVGLGEVIASREPIMLRTLLGSCVAACIYDPERGVGGMNHFMLPDCAESSGDGYRFGARAMARLVEVVVERGGARAALRAKVFGAAHVLRGVHSLVPESNARFVLDFLAEAEIPVVAQQLGGDRPLELLFETGTGRAFARSRTTATSNHVAGEESGRRTPESGGAWHPRAS